jgi:hypothetical protein
VLRALDAPDTIHDENDDFTAAVPVTTGSSLAGAGSIRCLAMRVTTSSMAATAYLLRTHSVFMRAIPETRHFAAVFHKEVYAITDYDTVLFDHRQRKFGRRPIGPLAPELKQVPARSSPC